MQVYMAVAFSIFTLACAKDLHIKESNTKKYGDIKDLPDLFHYNENFFVDKERYARHVELVTESVLEHLLKEINKKYSGMKNDTSGLPNMMRRMKMKLKKRLNNKKKNKKHKKKLANNVQSTTKPTE